MCAQANIVPVVWVLAPFYDVLGSSCAKTVGDDESESHDGASRWTSLDQLARLRSSGVGDLGH